MMKNDNGPPFSKVPKWLTRSDISCAAVRVYAEIGLHDGGKSSCTVSMANIGSYVGLSTSTVYRAVQELEKVGAIRVVRRFGQTNSMKTYQQPRETNTQSEAPKASRDAASRPNRPTRVREVATQRRSDVAPVDLGPIVAERARLRALGGDSR